MAKPQIVSEVPHHKLEGTEVEFGGRKWIVPALSMGLVEKFAKDLDEMSEEKDRRISEMTKYIPLIHAALQRNYPSLTLPQLKEMLSLKHLRDGTWNKIIRAVLFVNDLDKKPGEEGKAQAVAN